ncbi:MAG TPA: hypothetical protein VKA08_08540 [Balneolales bacterium]|nr:hypothetical protein [Balneolales bacterium]
MRPYENERESLKRALENQIRRVNSRIEYYDQWDSRISTIRLIVFLCGIVLVYLTAWIGNAWLFTAAILISLSVFIGLVRQHRKIDSARDKAKRWITIRSTHLARMSLDWDKIPEQHVIEISSHHPFAHELNIIGRHSLLELMDTAIYPGGSKKLTTWFTETEPDLPELEEHRALVRELKPLSYFRDRLQLKAMQVQAKTDPRDWDMATLFEWLKMAKGRSYLKSLILISSLAAINILMIVLFLIGVVKAYFIVSFVVYLFVYNLQSNKIEGLFDDAYRLEKLLRRFSNILEYLETYTYKPGSKLFDFCSIFHKPQDRPSRFLKKIIHLTAAASLEKNEIFHAIVNFLVPWDLYFAHRLNQYKDTLTDKLEPWLDRFYELEALCSIANFSWLNPDYVFPDIISGDNACVLKANDLGHPLIRRKTKVTNDLKIEHTGSLLLLTGSNMSGKSTFLRTLGINLCLTFAGGPVSAAEFQTIPLRIFSSINVSDSLDEGLSHFYAEVKRLRAMLDELTGNSQWPLFFMVDEIFKGTNNRERLTGSTALLKYVAGKNGIGVISTHDLELAQLEQEIPELHNWHFEETIENGRMSFKYKLNKGPCPTTNALRIMEMEGLPVKG